MSIINNFEISEKLQAAVEALSHHQSYDLLCHQHMMGEPMPSIEKLRNLVEKVREILFPGYFGNTTLDPVAIKYYMGV
jgi:serine O-acetyltransferase